jgi:hypothetical protein
MGLRENCTYFGHVNIVTEFPILKGLKKIIYDNLFATSLYVFAFTLRVLFVVALSVSHIIVINLLLPLISKAF